MPMNPRQALEELANIEAELKRRRYIEDPQYWAKERLGITLWSKQIEILHSVMQNRKTAVRSSHQIGKSFTAGILVAWWLDCHKPGEALVITSAPTNTQVKTILWKEIRRAHASGKLKGRTNQAEWFMTLPDGQEEKVAFGKKPADMDPAAFQGQHAKFCLLIFDEACGMPKALFDASDSLIANEFSRRLDIGNPDDSTSHFFKVCSPGSGWHVIGVSSFDTPAFTGEDVPQDIKDVLVSRIWVEEMRRAYARDWKWTDDGRLVVPADYDGKDINPDSFKNTDPLWQSKVWGIFPGLGGPQSLIPEAWISEAMERSLPPSFPSEFGVDVGAGGDSSTIAHRRGPVVRIIHSDKNPNTMQTMGNIVQLARESTIAIGAYPKIKIDRIGIGAGIVDRSTELAEEHDSPIPAPFVGINVGLPSNKNPDRFANLRAQNWWDIRTLFELGQIDIDENDLDLIEELVNLRYEPTSRGQIIIESKQHAKTRGIASPNRADALMLAMCEEPTVIKKKKAGVIW